MGSYNDKQPPVYIPPFDPPVGMLFYVQDRHGTRTTFEKQEDGTWAVVEVHKVSGTA